MTDEIVEGTEVEAAEGGAVVGTAVAVAERPGVLTTVDVAAQRAELRKDRLWLPFLIPVGAILAVALFTINISRVFLAASHDGATVTATIVTLAILVGATVVAALPGLRTSSLVLTVCGIAALVLLSGSLVLGASESKEEASAEPPGKAINTLSIDGSNFAFQATNFDVPAGINELKYISVEGSHTLKFSDPQFSYVFLVVPGGVDVAKAEFVEGETYTIYCTLPGHRESGMEATIKVGKPGTVTEPGTGTEPPPSTLPGPSTTTAPSGSSEVDPAEQSGNETGN